MPQGPDAFPAQGEEPIPLSALQHAVYCIRQAALIHLEQQWADNRFSAEGSVLHAVSDKGGIRRIKGVRHVHGLPLTCSGLGLSGIADLVEFHPSQDGADTPYPVEFKRGRPKLHRADEVQLCAQGICLEEMTGLAVPEGALFYAETRRRQPVPFDTELRFLTEQTVSELRAVFASGRTPPPTHLVSRCRGCSLAELCKPRLYSRPVRAWRESHVRTLLGDVEDPE
jgi:CRISPR-associated exonuclease Cas4